MNRREVLRSGVGAVLSACAPRVVAPNEGSRRIRAIAFDAFPIFDPRPVFARVGRIFGERGDQIAETWRSRQFEYAWLRALSGRYENFWRVTSDALVFGARRAGVEPTADQIADAMDGYRSMPPWPDVLPALRALRAASYRLAFLSNFTESMLDDAIAFAALDGWFDRVLSTDAARTYKPDPRAYRLGVDELGLMPDEIAFVAFAGWDAAGAKSFGYKTFWVDRLHVPMEQLGFEPDERCDDLGGLVSALAQA